MTQKKLTKENAKSLHEAADIIQDCFDWSDTDEGAHFWFRVVELLRNKASNGTSDGMPWVDPEPPIPEGWRRADHPDDYMRDDVKFFSKLHREWKDRSKCSPGLRFFSEYTYIVPVDPPLTDQDACVWPRLLVMVRNRDTEKFHGPYRLGMVNQGGWKYTVFIKDDERYSFFQARRATPEEIEAANGNS